ncbi:MAG: prephenate dehydrogenase/arogenate dehydrogenase family protein [Actinomycetota bacterium]
MARRVAILGTGLIGGSIGLRLRSFGAVAGGEDSRVVGYDRDRLAGIAARDRGAVDESAATPGEAVRGCDVVVLATPVDAIEALCRELAAHVEPDAVVTDVGSAKAGVVAAGEDAFGAAFVGGHPMAGSERHGIEAADPHLFEDAWWILTPTAATSSNAYSRLAGLIQDLGAQPVALAPALHDELVARLSHLPQLAASVLVEVASASEDRESLLGLAGGGFRDVTRIAASDPGLWVSILRSNRLAVLHALESYRGELEGIRDLIERDRWSELHARLGRARRARLELFAKPAFSGLPVTLSLVVPDRPGVLAEVTTAAGQLGANIEDLRIIHSTEGGRGRLELVIAGKEAAELLVGALLGLGYHVEREWVD